VFIIPLYWLLSPILWILLPVFAIFTPKLRHHWANQKSTWHLAGERKKEKGVGKQVVLFHAASAGEFEQLKPILKKVNRSRYFILLTFFSPTIFNIEKNTPLADAVCYHPFDFPWSALLFFRKFDIHHYIITRNDIWPTHLFIAKQLNINTILINANLYRERHYNSRFMMFFLKQIFDNFNLILTGSERLQSNLLNLVSQKKILVTGDSRLDRLLELKSENNSPLLPECFASSHTLILGSIIPSDFPVIFEGFKEYYPNGNQSLEQKDHRIIIVPHEINTSELNIIENKLSELGLSWAYYSEKEKLKESQVVIINKIGILANLYKYSDLAYVGAGFGAGVHSVMEPAVYKNVVSFGPNYQIVDMAVSLVEDELASIINNSEDFVQFLTLLSNPDKLEKYKGKMAHFIREQKLASDAIIKAIFTDE
jgi:3-deoxy-D-manno-octulosonic-acid transferase|tara:strand:+ start:132 stop:1406 length:1275 start_codon:yes stop_codon:yes gene_type:complete